MARRKKWRLRLLPMFHYEQHPSRTAAYAALGEYRDGYAGGVLNVHHVDVEVDEGDGWRLYERQIFPERDA